MTPASGELEKHALLQPSAVPLHRPVHVECYFAAGLVAGLCEASCECECLSVRFLAAFSLTCRPLLRDPRCSRPMWRNRGKCVVSMSLPTQAYLADDLQEGRAVCLKRHRSLTVEASSLCIASRALIPDGWLWGFLTSAGRRPCERPELREAASEHGAICACPFGSDLVGSMHKVDSMVSQCEGARRGAVGHAESSQP